MWTLTHTRMHWWSRKHTSTSHHQRVISSTVEQKAIQKHQTYIFMIYQLRTWSRTEKPVSHILAIWLVFLKVYGRWPYIMHAWRVWMHAKEEKCMNNSAMRLETRRPGDGIWWWGYRINTKWSPVTTTYDVPQTESRILTWPDHQSYVRRVRIHPLNRTRDMARDERDHTVHTGLRSWLGPLHSGPHAREVPVYVPSASNTSFLGLQSTCSSIYNIWPQVNPVQYIYKHKQVQVTYIMQKLQKKEKLLKTCGVCGYDKNAWK